MIYTVCGLKKIDYIRFTLTLKMLKKKNLSKPISPGPSQPISWLNIPADLSPNTDLKFDRSLVTQDVGGKSFGSC